MEQKYLKYKMKYLRDKMNGGAHGEFYEKYVEDGEHHSPDEYALPEIEHNGDWNRTYNTTSVNQYKIKAEEIKKKLIEQKNKLEKLNEELKKSNGQFREIIYNKIQLLNQTIKEYETQLTYYEKLLIQGYNEIEKDEKIIEEDKKIIKKDKEIISKLEKEKRDLEKKFKVNHTIKTQIVREPSELKIPSLQKSEVETILKNSVYEIINHDDSVVNLVKQSEFNKQIEDSAKYIVSQTCLKQIKEQTKQFLSKVFDLSKLQNLCNEKKQKIKALIESAQKKLNTELERKLGPRVVNQLKYLGSRARENVHNRTHNECRDE